MQALDTFNSVVLSPIYYVKFTSFTILAGVIMFKIILFCSGEARALVGYSMLNGCQRGIL
ncbi:putative magnesium transporter NIPA5, partial [Bienertia sinuspersici]